MQVTMRTRKRGDSGVSCSSCVSFESSVPNSKRRKCSTNVGEMCNGSSMPSKNHKLEGKTTAISCNNEKYLAVKLTDMLKDENLCSEYNLQQKFTNTPNIDSNSEANSSFMDSSVDLDSLSETASVERDQLSEERKIVLQDNFLITVTRTVQPQKIETTTEVARPTTDNSSVYSSNSTTDWDVWLNENTKHCINRTWQKCYTLAENDIMKITSHDSLFTGADLHGNDHNNTFTNRELKDCMTTIKVQISNDIQVPQRRSIDGSTFSNCSSAGSSNGSQMFKMPLPPAKRPPSRPKKIFYSSASSGHQLSIATASSSSQHEAPEDDDALSISASTLMDVEQVQNDFEQPISELSREADTVNSFEPVPFSSSASDIAAKNNDIQRWIENSSTLCPQSSIEPQTNTVVISNNNNSCASTSESENCCKSISKNGSGKIPLIYRKMRLCVYHFLDELQCFKKNCLYSHTISSINENLILKSNLAELKEAYKWSLQSKIVFPVTFKHFVKRFSRLKDTDQLISMVDDVLVLDVFDRTPYIKQLVRALQNTGYTFGGAIETLVRNYGEKNVCLLDILLNFVIESTKDLNEDWILIKEILKCRSGEIDFGVVNDIVAKALQLQTPTIYINVSQDVFIEHVNNFENIDKKLLSDFLAQLYSHKLFKECNILKTKCKDLSNGFSPIRDVCTSPNASSVVSQNEQDDDTGASIDLQSGKLEGNVQISSSETEKEDCCKLELDHSEILDLLSSLGSSNVNLFVALLNKYKCTDKVDSFALNTFVYLKENKVDKQYFNLLKSLELVIPDYMKDPAIKAIVEQISYNVVNFMTRQNMWSGAYKVLRRFEGTLETFVRSREFKKHDLVTKTLAERYLYICKIYIKNNQYKEAIRIFLRKDLNLLKPCSMWKIEYGEETERYRNRIVMDLLQGLLNESDVKSARFVLHHVIGSIQDPLMAKEMWNFYNGLIMHMLNKKEKFKIEILDEFQKRIFPSWHRRLKDNVLRGLGATLLQLQAVKEKDSIDFYNKCCKQNVYPFYEGIEDEICVKTDLISEEVYLMLLTFFYKIATNNYTPKALKINIECPDEIYNEPLILQNSDVGFTEMKKRVTDVLVKAFGVLVEESEVTSIDRFVVIKEKFVVNCVKKLQIAYGAN